jgi:hypothetical protein
MSPMYTVWASSHFEQRVWIAVNAWFCAMILFSIICRTRFMSRLTTHPGVIAFYVSMAMSAVASGASYVLWDEIPGPGQTSASAVILMFLAVSSRNWRLEQPPTASRRVRFGIREHPAFLWICRIARYFIRWPRR